MYQFVICTMYLAVCIKKTQYTRFYEESRSNCQGLASFSKVTLYKVHLENYSILRTGLKTQNVCFFISSFDQKFAGILLIVRDSEVKKRYAPKVHKIRTPLTHT